MTSSGSVSELADRQGFFFEVRRRSTRPADPSPAVSEGPWISVSRQLGSGGTELAAALGQELGWHVFDREILRTIAEETDSREELLGRLDERAVRQLDEYLAPLIVPDDPGQARYLVEMTRLIGKLARAGRAILVGRGANWFLTPACGLRVRVVGSFPMRAATLAHSTRVDLERARRRVLENDEAQRAFVRQVWNRDIDDASGYDLVLNPGDMGLPSARAAVLAAARVKLPI